MDTIAKLLSKPLSRFSSFAAVLVTAILLLSVPKCLLVKAHTIHLWAAIIIAFGLLGMIFSYGVDIIKEWVPNFLKRKYCRSINTNERAVLNRFDFNIGGKNIARVLDISEPATAVLLDRGILKKVSDYPNFGNSNFAVAIPRPVWEYINKNLWILLGGVKPKKSCCYRVYITLLAVSFVAAILVFLHRLCVIFFPPQSILCLPQIMSYRLYFASYALLLL
jgi:hypothetical protein